MSSIPAGSEPDADLDQDASLYRAAVLGSNRRSLGPIAFLAVTALVAVVVAAVLALAAFALSQVRIGPQLISAAAKAAPAPSPTPPAPAVMPQGVDAFAR